MERDRDDYSFAMGNTLDKEKLQDKIKEGDSEDIVRTVLDALEWTGKNQLDEKDMEKNLVQKKTNEEDEEEEEQSMEENMEREKKHNEDWKDKEEERKDLDSLIDLTRTSRA